MTKVTIGDATLYLGDCLEILPTLGKVDACITDPPYGVNLGNTKGAGKGHGLKFGAYNSYDDTYENFVNIIVPRINYALSISERSAVFTGQHIHEQAKPDAIGGIFCPAASGRHCWGFKSFLPVLLYGKAKNLHMGSKATAITSTEIVNRDENNHPVAKPIGWMKWLILLASEANDVVLDPFMGSGTTGVAAIQLGRKFIGIEKDERYFEIARSRIEQAVAQGQLFEPAPARKQEQSELTLLQIE